MEFAETEINISGARIGISSPDPICLGKGNKSVCERYLITKLQN